MVRVNFTCFPEKVRSGSKLQTIRPPRDDVHVGDSLGLGPSGSVGRVHRPCAQSANSSRPRRRVFKAHGGAKRM